MARGEVPSRGAEKESAVSSLQGDESERRNTAMDQGTTKEPGT